jgi:pimeloyl-ACP methyl ester carboxylesterase
MRVNHDGVMNTQHEPLLLISGAGLGAWIWEDLQAELGTDYDTRVAARPGGDRAPSANGKSGASLEEYAHAALESAPWPTFTVVAHSAGGAIAAQMARIAPERVTAVLGVSALVPDSGASIIGTMPAPQRYVLGLMMRLAGTKPPESAIRKGLASGVDVAVADRLVAEFAPESVALFRDTVSAGSLPERRGYVFTLDDAEFPLALQRRFAEALGASFTREVPGGHLPMLEQTSALASAIREFTRP